MSIEFDGKKDIFLIYHNNLNGLSFWLTLLDVLSVMKILSEKR
jgi:hypothetical protein